MAYDMRSTLKMEMDAFRPSMKKPEAFSPTFKPDFLNVVPAQQGADLCGSWRPPARPPGLRVILPFAGSYVQR